MMDLSARVRGMSLLSLLLVGLGIELIPSFQENHEICVVGFTPFVTTKAPPRIGRGALTYRNTVLRQFAILEKEKTVNDIVPIQENTNKNEEKEAINFPTSTAERHQDTTLDLDEAERQMAMTLAGAELSLEKLLVPLLVGTIAVLGAVGIALSPSVSFSSVFGSLPSFNEVIETAQAFRADPQGTIQSALDGMGPMGIVYFGMLYLMAELLAIPATPLTLSAGYLFGLKEGILVVLAAGTLSAMIGFFIGKTLLRNWVETVLEENPQFKKLDTAIGAEGFKLLVLVRLSPIFPFSLLNYTYGASSISFPTFVAGTLLGFTPSTIGYVYTGLVGKELLLGQGDQPWYVYAAGLTALLGFLKLVTDVATEIVQAIDNGNEEGMDTRQQ